MSKPLRIKGEFYNCETKEILKLQEGDVIAGYPEGTIKIFRPHLGKSGIRRKGDDDDKRYMPTIVHNNTINLDVIFLISAATGLNAEKIENPNFKWAYKFIKA
jgi:hypothetical protein